MEKENSTLKNENQRLRIKTASSKVASTNPSLAGTVLMALKSRSRSLLEPGNQSRSGPV